MSEKGFVTRCKKIFKWLDDSVDAILIFNKDFVDKNFFYITGLFGGVFENCGIVVDRKCEVIVLSTALEEEILRGYFPGKNIYTYRSEDERDDAVSQALKGYNKVGVSFRNISHSTYTWLSERFNKIEWSDASFAFRMARMIKTGDEVEKIEEACIIASKVADEIPRFLRIGMTELDLAAEIEYRLKSYGAHGIAFSTIVAFGENSSKPHYFCSDVKLDRQNVVLVDFGAEYMGYVSDITQTILINNPPEELIDIYETVYRAQRIAFDMIGDGVDVKKVDKEVRGFIDSKEKYRGRFIHSLGHSIGRDVHDDGYPGDDWGGVFKEGMVLTVEPGIYIPSFYGVRLEDDIVVTKDGCKILTTASKELQINAIH